MITLVHRWRMVATYAVFSLEEEMFRREELPGMHFKMAFCCGNLVLLYQKNDVY